MHIFKRIYHRLMSSVASFVFLYLCFIISGQLVVGYIIPVYPCEFFFYIFKFVSGIPLQLLYLSVSALHTRSRSKKGKFGFDLFDLIHKIVFQNT